MKEKAIWFYCRAVGSFYTWGDPGWLLVGQKASKGQCKQVVCSRARVCCCYGENIDVIIINTIIITFI